jgi:phage-related protein (TIGR01555 family)
MSLRPGKKAKTAKDTKATDAQKPRGLNAAMIASMQTMDQFNAKMRQDATFNPFVGKLPQPPPGIVPKGITPKLANDDNITAYNGWAVGQLANNAINNGTVFLGFPYLSELAQIPEYRYLAEVTATEMTREWIGIKSTATDDEGNEDKIIELVDFMKKLDVQGNFERLAELDYFFGRSHLYLDTGDTDNPDELKTPIGNGLDEVTAAKGIKLKALKVVEPIWCYPAHYTSNNPLKQDWYKPQSWYALGTEVHGSRLLTFVGREVPDMLKPSFMFGGLSMSQMAMSTVNNWLRARKSVSDVMYKYSVNILKTDLEATGEEGGITVVQRANLISQFLNNNGLLLLDNEDEDFVNVSAPLSGLDQLQAQAQEHMSAVSRIPLVKLTGLSPSGLNASSEGEIQIWYEWIKAYQEKFFANHLETVIAFCQISLWGKVDPDIVWEFKPLKSLSAKELAEIQKLKAETDSIYVTAAVMTPEDIRAKVSADPDAPYDALGQEDEIDDDLMTEMEAGLTGILGGIEKDRTPERGGPRKDREPPARTDRDVRPAREARPARPARPPRGSRARSF